MKYKHQHRLLITCKLITHIPVTLLSNERINGEEFGYEQSLSFWNLAILHRLLAEDEFK